MYTKNTALGDVSQDKYSTWVCHMLYLSLNMPPHAVFVTGFGKTDHIVTIDISRNTNLKY